MAWAVAGAAVVTAGAGIYKTIKSSHDGKKAREAESRLQKPYYNIQDEYYKNQQLSQGLATQGYTTAAKNYLTEKSQSGLGSGIDAIEATGGSANDIAKLYGVYQDSMRNNAAGDAQQQIENIKSLMSANKDIAGQKTTKWSLDEDRQYQTQLKQYRQQEAINNQNKWNGISETAGAIGAAGTAFSNSGLLTNGGRTTTPQNPQSTAPVEVSQEAATPVSQTMQASSWDKFFGQNYQ